MIVRIITLLLGVHLVLCSPQRHFKYFGVKDFSHGAYDNEINKISGNLDTRRIFEERADILSGSELEKLIAQAFKESQRTRRQADYEDYEDDLAPGVLEDKEDDQKYNNHRVDDTYKRSENKPTPRPRPVISLRRFSPTTLKPRSYQKNNLQDVKRFLIKVVTRPPFRPKKLDSTTPKSKTSIHPHDEDVNEEEASPVRQRFGGIQKPIKPESRDYADEDEEIQQRRQTNPSRRNRKGNRTKPRYSDEESGDEELIVKDDIEQVSNRKIRPSIQRNKQYGDSSVDNSKTPGRKAPTNKPKTVHSGESKSSEEAVPLARKVPEDNDVKATIYTENNEGVLSNEDVYTTNNQTEEKRDSPLQESKVSAEDVATENINNKEERGKTLKNSQVVVPEDDIIYEHETEEDHLRVKRDIFTTIPTKDRATVVEPNEGNNENLQESSSELYALSPDSINQNYQDSTESDYYTETVESTSGEELSAEVPTKLPLQQVVDAKKANNDNVLITDSAESFVSPTAVPTSSLQTESAPQDETPTTYRPKRIQRPKIAETSNQIKNLKNSNINEEAVSDSAEIVQQTTQNPLPRVTPINNEKGVKNVPKTIKTEANKEAKSVSNRAANTNPDQAGTVSQQTSEESTVTTARPKRINRKTTHSTTTAKAPVTQKPTTTKPITQPSHPTIKQERKDLESYPPRARQVPPRARKTPVTNTQTTFTTTTTTTTTATTKAPLKSISEEEYENSIEEAERQPDLYYTSNSESSNESERRQSESSSQLERDRHYSPEHKTPKNPPKPNLSTQRPKGRRIAERTYQQSPDSSSKKPSIMEDEFKRQAEGAHYSFGSKVDDTISGAHNAREETRDGVNVKGKYSYNDGYFQITVHYEADDKGFRIVKQEKIPVGNGPEFNPDGEAMVSSHNNGNELKYKVTEHELVKQKQRKKTIRRVHLINPHSSPRNANEHRVETPKRIPERRIAETVPSSSEEN